MSLYLDSSALVKKYVGEPGSSLVREAIAAATTTATVVVAGAEVAATLARMARTGVAGDEDIRLSLAQFWREWDELFRLRIDDSLIKSAAGLAWRFGLRGYDSVHLAACLRYAESAPFPIRFVTFDRALCSAGRQLGIETLPADLDEFIARHRRQAGG